MVSPMGWRGLGQGEGRGRVVCVTVISVCVHSVTALCVVCAYVRVCRLGCGVCGPVGGSPQIWSLP